MTTTIWKNCYSQRWAGILIPAAFAHPAKISLALAKKIFAHALEHGWIQKGDTCVDPFAGIGGVAFGAMAAGLNFIGQELEPHFIDLANGMDCTDEKLCPTCAARSQQPASENLSLFDEPKRPHRFEGNLEFWKRKFGLSGAVIVQGDSRKLLENLRGRVECVVSSPPYADQLTGNTLSIDDKRMDRLKKAGYSIRENGLQRSVYSKTKSAAYSKTKDNFGNLPMGNFDALISSPPYAGNEKSDYHLSSDGKTRRRDEGRGYRQGAGCFRGSEMYGQSDGQLGAMRDKDFDLVVSSPPYVDSIRGKGNGIDFSKIKDGGTNCTAAREAIGTGYGESFAQLAAMPEGCFDIAVSSPTFENMEMGCNNQKVRKDLEHEKRSPEVTFGNINGQLGGSGETFWSAAREIVQQCFLALKPGGHAIWVCKSFVRKGQVVEFSQQWAKLCESVGFKLVCWHYAMLTENGAVQINLDGEETRRVRERKSFFRRLAEKNGSPRIDWEDVICFVKPARTFERLFIDGTGKTPELKTATVELE